MAKKKMPVDKIDIPAALAQTCDCLCCDHGTGFETIKRLDQDMKRAAATLTREEVSWYVKRYYQIQGLRVATNNMLNAAIEYGTPNQLLKYELSIDTAHERQIQGTMQRYAFSKMAGRWMLSLYGVGPVISAGFLSHFDITKAPTSGHFISYAGLDPRQVWPKRDDVDKWVKDDVKEYGKVDVETVIRACAYWHRNTTTVLRDATRKRKADTGMKVEYEECALTADTLSAALARIPWKAELKRLCWIFGDVMVKFHNAKPGDNVYGEVYAKQKARAIEKNANGGFAELAEKTLQKRTFRDKKLEKIYQDGKIPPGRVDYWARRKVIAVFLNHLHYAMYVEHHGVEPPLPYVFAMGVQDHVHYIPVPHWPIDEYLASIGK